MKTYSRKEIDGCGAGWGFGAAIRWVGSWLLAGLVAMVMLGCEPGVTSRYPFAFENVESDTEELLDIVLDERQALERIFDIQIPVVRAQSKQANGNGGFDYQGQEVGGYALLDLIVVAKPYSRAVIRHELLHVAGYEHRDQVVNGVRVANHVYAWHD